MSQDYDLLLVEFLAIQKIMWFSHYLYLFFNKILIEREYALRFKKKDINNSFLIN